MGSILVFGQFFVAQGTGELFAQVLELWNEIAHAGILQPWIEALRLIKYLLDWDW